MLSFGEEEVVFFDATDYLVPEESVVMKKDRMCSNLDYDVWLRELQSIDERREIFLSRMGFVECSSITESEFMRFERSTSESSSASIEDNLLSERQNSNSKANCSVDYSDQDWLDDISVDVEGELNENLVSTKQCEVKQAQASRGQSSSFDENEKKVISWWRHFTKRIKKKRSANLPQESKLCADAGTMTRMRMEQNQKRYIECTAMYAGQEIKAHDGLIWTMKFSPNGRYLASGGEDGVVCLWRVTSIDASCKADKCSFGSFGVEGRSSSRKKKSIHSPILTPEKIFHIEEEPLYKFRGHSSDVLDLAWSTSNYLLSSSMDKTVRLWQPGFEKCLGVFHHSNYVTCVQFNPVDENHFISGCIDGKVRIWGIPKGRVEDWANVLDIVTAVRYQPNGKGFVVGSVSGTCRFYESSGDELLLNAEINIDSRKKLSGNKITGIEFLKNNTQRVMITSEDSKIRILDGQEVVRKYKGLPKSGSQKWASVTSSGKHIVSVGDDSRVYLWNYDDLCIPASKQAISTRSCEHFFSEGVSVALPWSDLDMGQNCCACGDSPSSDHQGGSSGIREPEHISLANWFSMDGSSGASTTWPEEKLPLWDLPPLEHDCRPYAACGNRLHLHLRRQQQHKHGCHCSRIVSATWGLVFVTANRNGTIRTHHNYGLPVRN